jgi:glycosyltransferase involved in cell wall biosynthesis
MSNQSLPLDAYIDAHANRICHLALACGADMIHSATNWLVGLPALTAAKRLGLPFVYEMRGLMEVTRASTTPLYAASDHFELFRRMESEIASAADLVFAITSGVRDEMARRGCDTSRFRLAPNGVDVERFQPLERNNKLAVKYGIGSEMVFGFVGSFVHYEGLLDLCKAAAALKARGRHFKLLLVGDGAHSADVHKAVDSLGIADVTILTGHVSFELVPDLYSLIDVAVYPRRGIEVTDEAVRGDGDGQGGDRLECRRDCRHRSPWPDRMAVREERHRRLDRGDGVGIGRSAGDGGDGRRRPRLRRWRARLDRHRAARHRGLG